MPKNHHHCVPYNTVGKYPRRNISTNIHGIKYATPRNGVLLKTRSVIPKLCDISPQDDGKIQGVGGGEVREKGGAWVIKTN